MKKFTHSFFCIKCQSPMLRINYCPFCQGDSKKAGDIILRRQSAVLNKWIIKTFFK